MTKKKKKKRKRDTSNDVGLDGEGRPFMIGDAAADEQSRIIEHPDAKPVLVIAELDGDIGIRVFGPPSLQTADLLEQLAAQYRSVVQLALGRTQ